MIRNFAASAPLFGSPKVFVNALKGQGMFGTALAALGLQPITLKSEDETLKQIATESKLFSIYATGRVKAGARETVSRIHAVVDFRNAPAPGIDTRALDNVRMLAEASGNTAVAGQVEQAIDAAMRPSPGGNIVYYRLD
jgi:general secretion pathway protein K